jgi:hypothetical protein
MANINVISGKNGKLTWASNVLYLESWKINLKIDLEEYSHFSMTQDSNSLIFKQLVDGFASATASVSGKFDNTVGAYINSTKTLYPQVTATAYFGLSATVGFTATAVCESISPSQSVSGPYATYDAELRLTSLVFTTTG